MDRSTLEALLRQMAPSRGHTPDCPSEDTLVSALHGNLDPGQREVFDRHVADCDDCIGRLGQVARLGRVGQDSQVPDTTMARARRIPRRVTVRRQAPRWAAAAVLVLAVAITADHIAPQRPDAGTSPPPVQQVRNIDRDALLPSVLYPAEGATIGQDGGLFRWSEAPGSLYYDVRIVSGDGSLIWQERTERAEWRLPAHLHLGAGEEYYFRVDAYLTEAKRVSSPHLLFFVKESQ